MCKDNVSVESHLEKMSKISELDELLSDPDYVYSDGFWSFYEIAISLKKHEWLSLVELAESRDQDWSENLLYAAPFRQGRIEDVLPCIFAILKRNTGLAIDILRQLDSGALRKILDEAHIIELAKVWKSEPKLRESVKIACRDAQQSGVLRKHLGLNNWEEACEKYPT